MNKSFATLAIFTAAAILFIASGSVFVVRQTEQAIVLQFRDPVAVYAEPGLKFKIPFIQDVKFFEKRLLGYAPDPRNPMEVIASDQKRLIVNYFVRYRITDPLQYYRSTQAGNELVMQNRLRSIVDGSLRQALGSAPLSSIISDARARIMRDVRDIVNDQVSGKSRLIETTTPEGETAPESQPQTTTEANSFGIEVVDVRIMRADLPPENSQAIYRRMQTEREQEAKQIRAQGEEEALRVRSRADRERTEILAEAQKEAETIRGRGDARATEIFAEAFGRDEEFYDFYRTMQAYRAVLTDKDTQLILSPDSAFLKRMGKGSE